MAEGKLKPQPVYIGGLGRVFTEIYDLESHRAHRQLPNLQLHEALNLVVLEKGQAEKMKLAGRLFVITAGMMTEKTAAHDLAVRMMGDERHAIFLVGYTDPTHPANVSRRETGRDFHFQRRRRGGHSHLRSPGIRSHRACEPWRIARFRRTG